MYHVSSTYNVLIEIGVYTRSATWESLYVIVVRWYQATLCFGTMDTRPDRLIEAENIVLKLLSRTQETMGIVGRELAGQSETNAMLQINTLSKDYFMDMKRLVSILKDEGERWLYPFEDYEKDTTEGVQVNEV